MRLSFDVIVVGSLHQDIVVRAPRLPVLDETLPGTGWALGCGGKGGNQAVLAATLGARTAMVGRTGDDEFGRRLLANLERTGVDRRLVGIDAVAGSGMSVAVLAPSGEYGAVIVSGANLGIDPAAMAGAWESLGGAAVLVLQNEVPEPVNLAAATAAKAAGARVLLNAAPARPTPPGLLDLVDVLVVNRVEAEMLTGRLVADPSAVLESLLALGAGRHAVVVTLGGQGLVAFQAGTAPVALPALPADVRSTHGAGDCFVAALAADLAAGVAFAAALRFANAAAGTFVGLDEAGRARFSRANVPVAPVD